MACIANNDNPSSPSYALLKNNCTVAKLLSSFCFLLCAECSLYYVSAMHITFATKVVAEIVLEIQASTTKIIIYFKILWYPWLNHLLCTTNTRTLNTWQEQTACGQYNWTSKKTILTYPSLQEKTNHVPHCKLITGLFLLT